MDGGGLEGRWRTRSAAGHGGGRDFRHAIGVGHEGGVEERLECARWWVGMAKHHGIEMRGNIGGAQSAGEKSRDQFFVRGVEAYGHRVSRCERLIRQAETWKARKIGFLECELRVF